MMAIIMWYDGNHDDPSSSKGPSWFKKQYMAKGAKEMVLFTSDRISPKVEYSGPLNLEVKSALVLLPLALTALSSLQRIVICIDMCIWVCRRMYCNCKNWFSQITEVGFVPITLCWPFFFVMAAEEKMKVVLVARRSPLPMPFYFLWKECRVSELDKGLKGWQRKVVRRESFVTVQKSVFAASTETSQEASPSSVEEERRRKHGEEKFFAERVAFCGPIL
ncbi:hypothetical protein HHK36_012017 [Tetracentron sinense]|uniref:Uncharacterized protein n=1 Tax=Tetracentron sinense TaxID=13715 RepID=A0A834ZHH8_TETSI|nr:hypothetical protein HHK36_012017 [Tetracentron sinense]